MDIIVISDTHGAFDTLYQIVDRNFVSDMFIHLGDGEYEYQYVQSTFYDKPFIFIKGNNDWGDYPQNLVTELSGKKFYMCHGHRFERSRIREFLAATAVANGCDIALYGHTHMPYNENENGILLFNPGSAVLPHGGYPPTYGKITIDENGNVEARIIEIDF